ncbi:sigma 54-interacting transcriptional regulator [Fonticella tunisiensis]|uniref:PAS domain S-box-containing protein n=1 Tax=Fonticella tunisiensis TaxID=1096341 RepID=A0A4R7KTM8_9CLOT|nr:sigma 54-interacting transcriptional regulator [Fonticella tunisiensis]TDT62793.1 PAS domain S-box-containing protein [Fonticella tunisiensis]
MGEIVLIAPYENLGNMAREVIKKNGFDIDVVIGDLSDGVKAAQRAVKEGAQVLISRGGTYTMIKGAVEVPVVEIKMSSFDILRGFKNLMKYPGKIGVAGYRNVIYGCDTVAELLNVDVEMFLFDNEVTAPLVIEEAISRGIKVFIGDAIGYKSARAYGCESYLITSGKESIYDSVQEAMRILEVTKTEKAKAEKFKTILDFINDGILAVDKHGIITTFNPAAEWIFQRRASEVVGRKVGEVIPNTGMLKVIESGSKEIGVLQDINRCKIVTNRVPIVVDDKIVGAVATFQDVTQIQDLEYKIRREQVKKGFVAKYNFDNIVHVSRAMEECIERAKKYSKIDSPVLILGESGVGKELFAQSIHNESPRRNGPFVAVNCAALPPNLLESELFGYVEGAFTGAKRGGKPGLFELAHKGSIFLDEIGELSMEFQARLLRVLQQKEVMRIGDDKVIPIDVRIIAATNKDIAKMVSENKFREDLYYRINILTLYIPALRFRREDVIPLINHFINKYSLRYGKNITGISSEVQDYLLSYNYRGNIRELQGIMERAVALCEGDIIQLKDVEAVSNVKEDTTINKEFCDDVPLISLRELEINYINKVIEKCCGNISEAAKILGIDRSTIWRKLKKDTVV